MDTISVVGELKTFIFLVNRCFFFKFNSTFYMNYHDFQIIQLGSNRVKNINDEEIAELILL